MNLKVTENKTRSLILAASKRAQRDPGQSKQAIQETRLFARELLRIRKQRSRLVTSKAQLQSVQMQVGEAFAVRKIQTSMKASTSIMKEVNTLIRLPELSGTMQELSQELMKAGIREEMIGDTLDAQDIMDEEAEADEEVDKVLGEVLKGKLGAVDQALPGLPAEEVEDEEEKEAELEQMRGRLEALKS